MSRGCEHFYITDTCSYEKHFDLVCNHLPIQLNLKYSIFEFSKCPLMRIGADPGGTGGLDPLKITKNRVS